MISGHGRNSTTKKPRSDLSIVFNIILDASVLGRMRSNQYMESKCRRGSQWVGKKNEPG